MSPKLLNSFDICYFTIYILCTRNDGQIGGQRGNKIQVRTYGTYQKRFRVKTFFWHGQGICAGGSPEDLNILKFYFRAKIKDKFQLRATCATWAELGNMAVLPKPKFIVYIGRSQTSF